MSDPAEDSSIYGYSTVSTVKYLPMFRRIVVSPCPIHLFIFYILWIFWDKPHIGTGIVNIDMNTIYVMLCML